MMTGDTQRVLILSACRLEIHGGCWKYDYDDWKYTEVAGIISVTAGNTHSVLELSAWRLEIHRGCWNYQHDDWKHAEGAGIIRTEGNIWIFGKAKYSLCLIKHHAMK
jgi:hypothetical protein